MLLLMCHFPSLSYLYLSCTCVTFPLFPIYLSCLLPITPPHLPSLQPPFTVPFLAISSHPVHILSCSFPFTFIFTCLSFPISYLLFPISYLLRFYFYLPITVTFTCLFFPISYLLRHHISLSLYLLLPFTSPFPPVPNHPIQHPLPPRRLLLPAIAPLVSLPTT